MGEGKKREERVGTQTWNENGEGEKYIWKLKGEERRKKIELDEK